MVIFPTIVTPYPILLVLAQDPDLDLLLLELLSLLVSILFTVSTACLRSSIGNNIQYNFIGSVFLNTSSTCGSP